MSVGLRKKIGQLFKNEGDRLFSENHEPQCIVSSDASQTSSCKDQVERKIKTLDVFRVQAIPEVDPHIKHGDHPTLPLATCTKPRIADKQTKRESTTMTRNESNNDIISI